MPNEDLLSDEESSVEPREPATDEEADEETPENLPQERQNLLGPCNWERTAQPAESLGVLLSGAFVPSLIFQNTSIYTPYFQG